MCRTVLITLIIVLNVAGGQAQPSRGKTDPALVPPALRTNPSAQYSYDSLDYGMNMGIEKTRGGRYWMCWTAGGDDPNSFMLLASSDDRGKSWSAPRLVVDGRDASLGQSRTIQNGNLWTDPTGSLWFFFDQAMMDFDGRAGVWYTVCKNPDSSAPKWSAPKRIWHGTAKSKPIVLSSGEWVLPISLLNRKIIYNHPDYIDAYHELDSLRGAHMFVSNDKGRTWMRRGAVKFSDPSFDEHHILELRDGRLWMTARTNNGIWQSFSGDKGATWSMPQKLLEHVSSRHFVRRLSSGNILLVKHGNLDERTKKRSHLSAFLSEDDGKTWKGGLLLDGREGISYPDGFQDEDGTICVTHDYKRSTYGHIYLTRFTEVDILQGKFVSEKGAAPQVIYRPLGVRSRENPLPDLGFHSDPDFLKLPDQFYWGEVSGIAINSKGHIFVLSRGKHPLAEFSPDGEFIRTIADEIFVRGHGLRIDKYDNLWVSDREAQVVYKLSPQGKVLLVLGRWKSPGIGEMFFDQPTDIAFDSQDNIYITDGYGNSRVVKYSKEGAYLKAWGEKGTSPGQFDLPHTIVVDGDNNIYVGDRNNNRIQIFNTEGQLLNIWTEVGSPWGLALSKDGFFMADGTNSRIVKLNKEGRITASFGRKGKQTGEFEFPHMLAIDKQDNVYVAEILNWRIQKLIPNNPNH